MIRFSASNLKTELLEYNILIFCLSSKDHYLTIQRNVGEHNDFGDIHFECDAQGWGDYDVIKSVEINARLLRISLLPEQAGDFEGRLEYEIDLALDQTEFQKAVIFLQRLFEGTDLLMIEM